MRASGAVDELQVGEQGLLVVTQADRHLLAHAVEEQGLVALGTLRDADAAARQGRHEDLRLEAGGADRGDLADLRREKLLADQEDVGVELRALVAGRDL